MPTFYTQSSTSRTLEPEENVFVWFGKPAINGCDHAIVLWGGDLVLLKTVETISRTEVAELAKDSLKWQESFGTGQPSEELRAAVLESHKVNDWG